jgi:hypothetical protein
MNWYRQPRTCLPPAVAVARSPWTAEVRPEDSAPRISEIPPSGSSGNGKLLILTTLVGGGRNADNSAKFGNFAICSPSGYGGSR